MTAIVSIDKAGRIVLPKTLRDQFNLHPGSQLEITPGPEFMELKPIDDRPTLVCEDGGLWVHQAGAQALLGDAVRRSREERLGRQSRGVEGRMK